MEIKIVDARRREAPTSGYGLMSLQYEARLKNLGYKVHYFDQEPEKKADIWLWIRPPHYIKEKYFDIENFNVFFTMHETEEFTGWKRDWPELLNKCKAVITPTEWNKEVFVKNGVKVPVYVVPLGVDQKVFRGYKLANFSILSVFDSLGSGNARDNWRENISAYYTTFYNNHYKEVVYIIKSWRIDYLAFQNFKERLIKEKNYKRELLPDIQIYEIDLVPQDMNLFYTKHHSFLKNSSGEGWSLPGLEALACGLRVISRPTPAMLTYLNETNCDFFESERELADKLWENYRRWRKSRVNIDKFSWRNSAVKLDKVLKELKH